MIKDPQITHADGCWSWGPQHYLCAHEEIKRLLAVKAAAIDALAALETCDVIGGCERFNEEAVAVSSMALRKALK